MVFVGRVKPLYVDRGSLPPKLGRFNLASAEGKSLPLRLVYYSSPDTPRYISWQNLREMKDVSIPPGSVIDLGSKIISSVIHPPKDEAGAVLLNADQISDNAWDILQLAGDRFLNDLKKFCPWLVILPRLDRNGREAFGFDMAMTGAGDQEVSGFFANFADDLIDIADKIIFINPYYKSTGFFAGDGFELTKEMSRLVGRAVIKSVAASARFLLPSEVVDYFAAAYAQMVCQNFIRNYQSIQNELSPDAQVNVPSVQEMNLRLTEMDRQQQPLLTRVTEQQYNFAQKVLAG
ncbi:MAG: hypothetical protein PHG97_07630 [Candidatus Margulisbacteria bacterium]|nr:hypothetical protein [Candidatus Margulisiibacteriota bacterium]